MSKNNWFLRFLAKMIYHTQHIVLDIFGEHNSEILNKLNSSLYSINAIVKIPLKIKLSQSQIEAINARKMSNTGNLTCKLEFENEAQVILTTKNRL